MNFLFLLWFVPAALAASDLAQLAQSPEWLRLLHYKHSMFSGWRSEVDGAGYFLSPQGQKNPLAELQASLAVLQKAEGEFGPLKQNPLCAFPARKRFLEKNLGLKFPEVRCVKWQEFLERLDPAGISLVYATAYANNPASMFGHSFLKIRARKNESSLGQISLLDWSLNYAAMVPPDENGFAFAWFGITGGYPGQFATIPFYAKIEEYGYLESRDIWEYDLHFSSEEILVLLEAVWEIETNAYFDYFFFDENCSYQILGLLEIAKPDWKVAHYFLHMIPGESVKKVAGIPGAVDAVRMRPSLERKLKAAANAFQVKDREDWERLRAGGGIGSASTAALDAYLLFLQAEKQKRKDSWQAAEQIRMRETLQARAEAKAPSAEWIFGGEKTRPDIGHGAYHIGLGPTLGKGLKSGIELSLRLAYHDLLDADPGYTPHTEILFPHFKMRYFSDGKFTLDEVSFFSIVSLNPWSIVRRPLAWRAQAGYRRLKDLDCERCRGLNIRGGVGSAWSASEKWTLWAMGHVQGQIAAALQHDARIFYGPELGSLLTLPSEAKILLVARPLWGGGFRFWSLETGVSQPLSQNLSLRAEAEWIMQKNTKIDAKFLAVHYF